MLRGPADLAVRSFSSRRASFPSHGESAFGKALALAPELKGVLTGMGELELTPDKVQLFDKQFTTKPYTVLGRIDLLGLG